MAEPPSSQKKRAPRECVPSMEEVMDELQSRFLVNLPASELSASERLFFQIEQCYWFYEDFYADHFAHLSHLKLNDFASLMFGHCPLLQPLAHECESMFQDFKVYQRQVPVVGCILLNQQRTKILLVRNWKGTSWSFPRGKVNQGETDKECARREVLEECGYDVGDTLSDKLYVEFVQNEQRMRMYLGRNVPEDYHFAPQTRKEISLIQWFEFDALPKKTWCVLPFMARVRRWVSQDKTNKDSSAKGNGNTGNGKGRANSAPRNRPMAVITNTSGAAVTNSNTHPQLEKKKGSLERSVSTPHPRPVARKNNRGHFGTEVETVTSHDGANSETFGVHKADFSVEDMFRVNERLTGQKFEYDGNPHDFGKSRPGSATNGTTRGAFIKRPVPSQVVPRPAKGSSGGGASMHKVEEETPSGANTPTKPAPFPSFQFDAVDIMACVN